MSNQFKYYAQVRRPKGFWGKRAIKKMNGPKHALLPEWVFAEFNLLNDSRILDVGCGGGANIKRMLALNPTVTVTGLDISKLSMEETINENYRNIVDNRCIVVGGNAIQMPLAKESFELVTAFETIYFWSSLALGMKEMFRLLKPGGTCLIANEMNGQEEYVKELEKAANMRIYTVDDIKEYLIDAGFVNISTRQDEARHFICLTATKP